MKGYGMHSKHFYYVVISVPIQLIVALVLAYWLYKPTKFNKLCRSVFYVPVLCSFTAIGILFNLILNSTVGYIPYLINTLYTVSRLPCSVK